jgi:hypothetical protein
MKCPSATFTRSGRDGLHVINNSSSNFWDSHIVQRVTTKKFSTNVNNPCIFVIICQERQGMTRVYSNITIEGDKKRKNEIECTMMYITSPGKNNIAERENNGKERMSSKKDSRLKCTTSQKVCENVTERYMREK